ncbi:DNA polymerase I [Helicobacter heilmannii]|uniref:DNA polymerase n=1 Tax=Helicobacter heilmannii TaxID=35817 RepID=UPI0006A0181C|nr:DNA polymerase [Helicobacter heilmannii]CRF48006.1 DNA polymerase I [Helicobacter heilmannii]CRF51204.1 DNA polymerase I [Helicobacter heilmannii]
MKTLHLIDTFSLLFKFYYPLRELHTSKGFNTAWLNAFAKIVYTLYNQKAEGLIFALEGGSNHRKDLHQDYKAKRQVPPHLDEQLPIIFEWIERMGLCALSIAGYESDDVIASLCRHFQKPQIKIFSTDKDFFQLVSERVVLFDLSSKSSRGVDFCLEKYHIHPQQFTDYQGLVGDSIDGYKGVKGIGTKSAAKLLQEWQSLENIYANLDKLPEKLQVALKADKAQAFLSKKLATLKTDLPLDFQTPPNFPKEHPLLKITDALADFEMFSLLKQIQPKPTLKSLSTPLSTSQEVLDALSRCPPCVLQTAKTNEGVLLGVLPLEGKFMAVLLNDLRAPALVRQLTTCKSIAYDIKEVFRLLAPFGGGGAAFEDIGLLAWLENCYLDNSFNALALSLHLDAPAPLEGSTAQMAAAMHHNAPILLKAYGHYKESLATPLQQLAHNLEYPLLKLLYEMQGHGFLLDLEYLQGLDTEFQETLAQLEKRIHTQAHTNINPNSAKQWAQFLYTYLELEAKHAAKIKTGFSTNEASLKALQQAYTGQSIKGVEVSHLLGTLLEYREIFKLQSTYVKPLLEHQVKGKIHTLFHQTTTASSRLSSSKPNLQNIPMRTLLGQQIARTFIAPKGFVLLGLDYSQMELRLLAHFSEDTNLITAFKEHQDIHTNTALALFNDPKQRPLAKAINFGLIYGMGAKRLAATLDISLKEAREHMERYFQAFPTIKDFLECLKKRILEEGQVQTLLGHVRAFNFNGASPKLVADYLREGANTLFQGSASDLMKLAMLSVKEHYPQLKMLVQVHDELILEVPQERADTLAFELKTLMQGIYPLKVPLECHARLGLNWADLKA